MGGRSTPGRWQLARSFVCDDRRLVVGVGPAGTGKTTAMQLAARALAADGRRLVAVAPSARAAAVLGRQIGVPATTLAKLLHAHTTDAEVPAELVLGRGDVVLVDEAGMAGTPALGRLLDVVTRSGRGAAAGRGSDAAVRGRGRRGAAAAVPARPTPRCWVGCTGSPTRPKPRRACSCGGGTRPRWGSTTRAAG